MFNTCKFVYLNFIIIIHLIKIISDLINKQNNNHNHNTCNNEYFAIVYKYLHYHPININGKLPTPST